MSEVNKEFSEFGKKMLILAILALISFVLGIIGGTYPVVGYINLFVIIVYFILLILARGNIKNAAKLLDNKDLDSFLLENNGSDHISDNWINFPSNRNSCYRWYSYRP